MKLLFWIGLVVLVLGIASLLIPIPHSEQHGVNVAGMHMAVETKHSERMSPYISGVLILAGAGLMIGGARKG